MSSRHGLRDNRAELVAASVSGQIAPVRIHTEVLPVDREGRWRVLPASGGIALGVHAGDPVHALEGDHLMAGVSIEDSGNQPTVAGPLHLLSCVGNRVRNGRGEPIGIVAGKRGGLAPGFWAPQLVGVEVPDRVSEALTPEERIVVETLGRGLHLFDWPDIALSNLSPKGLDLLPLHAADSLTCDVAAIVPPETAGPGVGQDAWIGDLEITSERCLAGATEGLRYGDLVAFADTDSRSGRFYSPGRTSIGIVSHGPALAPGHGVGITILLTGPAERLVPRIGEGSLGPALRSWAKNLED